MEKIDLQNKLKDMIKKGKSSDKLNDYLKENKCLKLVKKYTDFLDNYSTCKSTEIIYCFINDITQTVTCPFCDEHLSFIGLEQGYENVCKSHEHKFFALSTTTFDSDDDSIMKYTIKKIIQESNDDISVAIKIIKSKHRDIYEWMFIKTPYITPKESDQFYSERIYGAMNDLTDKLKCPTCNITEQTYESYRYGYVNGCTCSINRINDNTDSNRITKIDVSNYAGAITNVNQLKIINSFPRNSVSLAMVSIPSFDSKAKNSKMNYSYNLLKTDHPDIYVNGMSILFHGISNILTPDGNLFVYVKDMYSNATFPFWTEYNIPNDELIKIAQSGNVRSYIYDNFQHLKGAGCYSIHNGVPAYVGKSKSCVLKRVITYYKSSKKKSLKKRGAEVKAGNLLNNPEENNTTIKLYKPTGSLAPIQIESVLIFTLKPLFNKQQEHYPGINHYIKKGELINFPSRITNVLCVDGWYLKKTIQLAKNKNGTPEPIDEYLLHFTKTADNFSIENPYSNLSPYDNISTIYPKIINNFSNNEETVMDVFAIPGATDIHYKNDGRKYIGLV